MKNIIGIVLSILFFSFSINTYGQTGPGGIGNATGANGQPTNIIWLRADDLGLANGAAVSAWVDASGNGNDLASSSDALVVDPTFVTNQINALPIVRFDATAGTDGTTLVKNPFTGFASAAVTTIVVYKSTDITYGLTSYATSSDNNNFLLFSNNNDLTTYVAGANDPSGQSLNNASFQIATHKWHNINSGEYSIFQDGSLLTSRTVASGRTITDGGCLAIGNEQDAVDGTYDAGQALSGDIAEIIMFSTYINDAQRTIIENYLNIKYGISISNDVFTLENASYNYGITGIGQELDGSHSTTSSAGVYLQNNGALDNGDYVMMSHNNSANSVSTSDLPATVEERWAKDWYVEQTNSQNIKLVFDLPEGITGGQYPQNISNYTLLYRNTTSGSYSIATFSSVGYGDADQVAFDILGADLQNGYYTLGTTDQANSPVLGAAGTTWYTLVSGDWNDPDIWTLDPSGALPNNPSNTYPQKVTDKVVIKSGKNIDMNLNNIHCASLSVDGRLDLKTSTGQTFDVIKGNGRILMAADNFPSFTDMSDFNTAGQGEGTVVYYGSTSYSLSTPHTFFNMEVNMDAGQTVTLLKDFTVNGYLRVDQGTFKINDGASTTNLNLTVQGDVTVQSAAFISTGTAGARHQFNFYGDFTNNGDVRFTNRASANYTAEATNGIVDANFLNGSKNQSILCNGTTNFYRIEIDKGTDDTYILDIQASSVANFNLFGYANQAHNSTAQLDDGAAAAGDRNPNALGLYRGTVKLGSNIVVNRLSNSGNYNISEAARLWVAGASVYNNNGSSTVPYGILQVSSGLMESKVSSGVTIRDNGLIKVSGGTLNTSVIRTSVLGAGNVGGYVQSGGTVNILNPGTSSNDYYHFCLTYPGNTFSMSGGTLHVYDANSNTASSGGIFIASDAENVNVTGGTVIAEIASTTNPFKITSKAPFYNLILRNTNDATTDHILDAGTGVSTTDENLAAQPLVVLNDLTIEDNCFLDHNGEDITIGGSFSIAENSQQQTVGGTNNYGLYYNTSDPNTLTFNGSGSDTLYIGHDVDDGYELYLSNLTINKNTGSEIVLKGDPNKDPSQTSLSGEWHNRLIKVNDTTDVINGTFNQGHQSIRLYGPAYIRSTGILGVYEPGVTTLTAYIMLKDDGTSSTDLNTEKGAQLGNFKLNPGNGKHVGILSDTYIKRIGYYSGSMNLRTYNLKVDYLHNKATTTNFASNNGATNKMIYSDGNASDGGISIYIPAGTTDGTTFALPLGTKNWGIAKYTPVQIKVYNVADDGYLIINPVDTALFTLNSPTSGQLQYYWHVDYSDFTTTPKVQFDMHYVTSDVDGNDNAYTLGRVIDPNVREEDGAGNVDSGNNILKFSQLSLIRGDYSGGLNSKFTGTVRMLYARKNGVWHDYTTWSTTRDGSSPLNNKNQLPNQGDICIIGTNTTNYAVAIYSGHPDYAKIKIAKLVILRYGGGESSLVTVGENGSDCDFGVITNFDPDAADPTSTINHASKIIISGPNLPDGDYGQFMRAPNTLFTFSRAFPGSNATIDDGSGGSLSESYYGSYKIGSSILEYPVLQFEYSGRSSGYIELPDTNIIVHGDIRFWKDAQHIRFGTSANGGDVVVEKNITFYSAGPYNIEFQATGTARTLSVEGDIDFNSKTNSQYSVTNAASSLVHSIKLKGNVINPSGSSAFNCYNGSGNASVNFEFIGETNSTFANMTTVPDFNQIIMNKGTDQTYTASLNSNFALGSNTAGTYDQKPIQLLSGTLILNSSAINWNISSGGDYFKIPSSSSLNMAMGTISINGGTGILLDGKLLVSGGTVDMTGGDNPIQYSATGSAAIEVTSGTLQVGSQIRRGTSSTEGVLTYTQSGGTVEIGTDAAGEPSRGIFEILNTGSSFTHTAGSFTLVNDYRSNPSTQSFYFDPETVNLSSGTEITFGNANTQAGSQNFSMYAGADLMNLTIDNAGGNNPKVTMNVLPLTLTENLNIGAGTELDANGWNINMYGNFNNSGTFSPNQNKVYFIGANNQEINGTTTFYQLYKNTGTDTLKLATATNITVDNYLSLETGLFYDGGNDVNVKGDLFNGITTLSSGSSNGIVLNGTSEQTITGNGTYARLTTDNPAGMIVPTGNTITITDSLQMRSGVFSIGQNLIVLTANADIIEASPFSESNMIQTNISFTDAGVKKYFPIISSATSFIYPMGSAGKYTPVKFDITANGNATGSIRIRAADERHPSVIEDSETPEITDADNVLQYYWTIDADGMNGFSAMATMDCYASDVLVNSPDYTEADYITARLLDAMLGTWDKFPSVDFNESTYELYFHFSGTDDLGIDGDYTAGIDDAIPDQVPSYISVADGDWTNVNTWKTFPDGTMGVNVPAGGPRGSIVYIAHKVTTPANFVSAYITRILAGGTLNVGTTFGHRLGFVSGTGTLYLERGDMPAGVYDGFFAPDSGTVEFSGIDNIDILSEVLSVNNLTLTGTGDRVFPNLDLVIHGNLIINGPDVKNTHNESVEVRKDVTFTSGTFDSGFDDGNDVNNGMFIIGGSTAQHLYGPATFTGSNAFNHFKMNNPIGLVLSQPIDINHQLVFTNGPITTTSTNILKLKDINNNVVTGAGAGNYVDGPMLKNINTNDYFDFPLGNANRYGNLLLTTNTGTSNQYWEAQYYNHNPSSDGYDPTVKNAPLQTVSDNEYWRLESTSAATALVALRWDSQSGMPTDAANYDKTRIAEWQNTTPQWEEVDANNTFSGAGSTGTVTSTVNSTFNEWTGTGNIFTLSTTYVSQAFTWDGSLSSAWNTSDNWNVNLVPTNLDDVTIPSGMPFDPTISINAECGAMDLQAGAVLTVNSGASLTLSGDLVMNGDITLKSDANATGVLLDNGVIGGGGTATVERYLSANNFHYIASPLASVPNTTFYATLPGETNVNSNYYLYDETNSNTNWLYGWTGVTNGNMVVGRGYAYYYTKNYTFDLVGGGFNTGTINYDLTNSNYGIQSDGWNLIGNPYPSSIRADEFIDANSSVINGTLYFWDDDGSNGSGYDTDDYATWNLAGAVGTGNGSHSANGTKVPDGYIGVGQGFFVRKTNAGTDPISFNNSMRDIGNGQFFKEQKTDNIWRLKLSVTNIDKKLYNEILVAFVDGASDGFDNLYDGVKLKGSNEISFYSKLGGKDYAIQSFAPLQWYDEKTVPLGVMINQAGDYSITVQQLENFEQYVNIYLKDNLLDSIIDLKATSSYTYTASAGTDDSRFSLYFNDIPANEGVVNHRPVLAHPIDNIQATEDVNFEFVVNGTTFNDVDYEDQLSYTAKLSSGADLPAWLVFDSATLTFTGLPANKDVDTLNIELTATDQSGEKAYDVFVLDVLNVNDPPELVNSIADMQTNEDLNFEFVFNENTFNDVDVADVINYSATLADGTDLPAWLSFNKDTRTFSGLPENSDVAKLDIQITAADIAGAYTTDNFILEVVNVNDNPELDNEIPDQDVDEGFNYSYSIPANTFSDVDRDDELTLSAKLSDGSSLPAWLLFDYGNGILYGIAENPGELNIMITATDKAGATATDEFMLTVKSTTGIDNLSGSIVSIYPNPTAGKFFVETDYYSDDLMIYVRDYSGRAVKEIKPLGKKTEVDISELASGVYYIELNNKIESKVFKLNLNK